MKSKFKKMINSVFSWKGICWMNAIFVVAYAILFILKPHPGFIMAALFHSCMILLGKLGLLQYKELCFLREQNKWYYELLVESLSKNSEYQKLYGPLPKKEQPSKATADSNPEEFATKDTDTYSAAHNS